MVVWVQNGYKCISCLPLRSRGRLRAAAQYPAQYHKSTIPHMLAQEKITSRSTVSAEWLSHHCKVEKS